jgi:hypothetical protein
MDAALLARGKQARAEFIYPSALRAMMKGPKAMIQGLLWLLAFSLLFSLLGWSVWRLWSRCFGA